MSTNSAAKRTLATIATSFDGERLLPKIPLDTKISLAHKHSARKRLSLSAPKSSTSGEFQKSSISPSSLAQSGLRSRDGIRLAPTAQISSFHTCLASIALAFMTS